METNVTNKGRPAVIVDWATYQVAGGELFALLDSWHGKATIVLLVGDPEGNDYDHEFPELFDVVIRNHGMTSNMAFKVQALCVLQDASALIPVIAFDGNEEILAMFEDGGVLVTYDS